MNRFNRFERLTAATLPAGRSMRPLAPHLVAEQPPAGRPGRHLVAALVASDVAAFGVAWVLAWALMRHAAVTLHDLPGVAAPGLSHLGAPALLLAGVIGSFHLQGHYGRSAMAGALGRQVSQVASTVMVGLFGFNVLSVVLDGQAPSVSSMLPWFVFVPIALAGRAATLALLARGAAPIRTVLIGDADIAAAVALALEAQPRFAHEVIETVSPARFAALAGRDGGRAALGAMQASFAVVALGGADPASERLVVQALDRDRAAYAVAPDAQALPITGTVKQSFFGHDVMLLQPGDNVARPPARLAKPAFDFAIALGLVLFLAPLLLALALLIRRDGGPAVFAHRRIGINGRPFGCFKFRTMVTDAEHRLAALLASDAAAAAEWAATHKLKADPRITRLGAFLRRTSLDELPQLFNVLRGEMSLVGPRPVVASEMPRYAEDAAYYCKARPGLTGLWQVSGRSDTSYERRVRLDVWYVRNWSFWHDLAILIKTIPAVLLGRGSV
jgi:undecaprenyl-phosphate galactose phosphotransferase